MNMFNIFPAIKRAGIRPERNLAKAVRIADFCGGWCGQSITAQTNHEFFYVAVLLHKLVKAANPEVKHGDK